MSGQEFGMWAALWAKEPFGDVRADFHAALIANTIANWSGKTLKKGAAVKFEDHLLFRTQPDEEPDDPAGLFMP